MRPQVLHEVNTTGRTDNYYEPLDDKETNNDVDESNHYAFTVTETTRSPNITFSSTIQIQTFELLYKIVRIRVRVAVASANGIAAHLSCLILM
jgi:hypothetical protein